MYSSSVGLAIFASSGELEEEIPKDPQKGREVAPIGRRDLGAAGTAAILRNVHGYPPPHRVEVAQELEAGPIGPAGVVVQKDGRDEDARQGDASVGGFTAF